MKYKNQNKSSKFQYTLWFNAVGKYSLKRKNKQFVVFKVYFSTDHTRVLSIEGLIEKFMAAMDEVEVARWVMEGGFVILVSFLRVA